MPDLDYFFTLLGKWSPVIWVDSKLMGAGGHELWTFKAIEQGHAEISMKYVRPWEKDQPPARTNVYTVIIKTS